MRKEGRMEKRETNGGCPYEFKRVSESRQKTSEEGTNQKCRALSCAVQEEKEMKGKKRREASVRFTTLTTALLYPYR